MSGRRGTLEQDDPRLIERIRSQYLDTPSLQPYQLTVGDDPSQGQSSAIRKIMGEFRDGFFVECGALDGETRSNSLVFEKTLGWRGLLIEGDPKNYELVRKKNRKAWTVGACLSTKPHPHSVMFKQQFNLGKISSDEVNATSHQAGVIEVQCLPIYSLLLALNVTTVNYFSLDVEGFELEVLKTIPWDKVDIQTLSVEFVHGAWSKLELKHYMKRQNYWSYNEVALPEGWENDFIFVKNTYKKKVDYLKSALRLE
ncbi:protein Star-like [Hyalella azteca]|uniref:Protein Star-like n=1 Tax=Hyalella azteca TaxID=294128 RepID=A0A8B7NSV9_HYAAZ|nr:protein Star-like [Hyalella azteca]